MKLNEQPGILVGGIPTPLNNIKVSRDDSSQYMEKKKIFQTTNQIYIYIAYPQWGQRAIHRLYIGYMVFVSAESLNSSASHNASDLAIGSWALGPFQHDFLGEHDVIGHWKSRGAYV